MGKPEGRPKGDSNQEIKCPECGRAVGNLPNHMRRSHGGDDV